MIVLCNLLAILAGLGEKREERGATAVEYALVVGLVSLVVVAAVALLKTPITSFVNDLAFR